MYVICIQPGNTPPSQSAVIFTSPDLELAQERLTAVVDSYLSVGKTIEWANPNTVWVEAGDGHEGYLIRVAKATPHMMEGVKQYMATATKPKTPAKAKAKTNGKGPVECLCACGSTTKGGRFMPGHDAKLKSALVKTAKDGTTATKAKARTRLVELGWEKYLPAE